VFALFYFNFRKTEVKISQGGVVGAMERRVQPSPSWKLFLLRSFKERIKVGGKAGTLGDSFDICYLKKCGIWE